MSLKNKGMQRIWHKSVILGNPTRLLHMADSFRLDRTAFHMGTHEEIERYHARSENETYVDRLRASAYLISVAFGYDLTDPPRLDRTIFETRKHLNG